MKDHSPAGANFKAVAAAKRYATARADLAVLMDRRALIPLTDHVRLDQHRNEEGAQRARVQFAYAEMVDLILGQNGTEDV